MRFNDLLKNLKTFSVNAFGKTFHLGFKYRRMGVNFCKMADKVLCMHATLYCTVPYSYHMQKREEEEVQTRTKGTSTHVE